MVQIGNDITPGVITEVTTANYIGVAPSAPRDAALVGPADLGDAPDKGNAEAEKVYTIVSARQAEQYFGAESMLTEGCKQALANGAVPIYAVAPAPQEVTGEALAAATEGELANVPISEVAADTVFSVGGSDLETRVVIDIDAETAREGEALVTPDGKYKLESAAAETDTVDYIYYDYEESMYEIEHVLAAVVDFVVPLQEDADTSVYAQTLVNTLQGGYDFAVVLAGAGVKIEPADFVNPFDDSRMQLYYPTRDVNGDSVMGAIAGLRASIALSTSPMMKGLNGVTRMYERIDLADEANLIENDVNPIRSRSRGAQVVEDLTSVADENSDEQGMNTGFTRLTVDMVTELVVENEEPFIGTLNTQDTRNNLQGVLQTQLKNLLRSQVIQDFEVTVYERDARSADVEVFIETTKGLRNIYNTITAGERVGIEDEAAGN